MSVTASELSIRSIDRYLPDDVKAILEERFWRTVEENSTLEVFSHDGTVLSSDAHPALFSDHGIVHARDVAAGTLELADILEGGLLPARPPDRREFVAALAVLIAYIHDVGMNDPTREGRRVHPIYAAQVPFSGAMDDVLARLWETGGPVVARIRSVGDVVPFRVPGDVVLRELAALSLGHSKSMVPATLHGDFARLRRALQRAVFVELEEHRRAGARLNPDSELPGTLCANARWYADPLDDSFAWLGSPEPAHTALAVDAVDAVRLVRVADALRQRGTALRTAAGYEIFVDAGTGQAVFSLRTADGDRLFLLRGASPLSAGEANLRKALLTRGGTLRISFHRGRFSTAEAAKAACDAAARVVADIGADVLGAFAVRHDSPDLSKPACDANSIRVELERPADEPEFAETVAEAAARMDMLLRGRIFVVADLENASPAERGRYLAGNAIEAGSDEVTEILRKLEAHGMRIADVDLQRAFEDVRRASVAEGEVLVEAGSPPAFVYIAVGGSLRIEQLGGYRDIEVPPWIPIGVTGVVRRAERNSTVVAAEPSEVLMIPGELFAREWFRPYGQEEFADVLAEIARQGLT
jgi:CRP-like cAMP-binding protein